MSRARSNRLTMPEWRRYMRFWGSNIERDIDDELRFHLEMRERDFLASGMSPHDAHDAAMMRFGPVEDVTNQLRDHDRRKQRRQQRREFMGALAQDIRYGVRKLLQSPAFSVAVIVVLALGIGVNTAIFSAVDHALLRPLPFKDSGQLALLEHARLPARLRGLPPEAMVKRSPDIHDVAAMTDVVKGWGAYAPGGLNLTGAGNALRIDVALATPGLFPLLGVQAQVGRTFVDDEGKPGGSNVAVLSHGLWQSQFGGDSTIVGRLISLNGVQHTVVGVMPAGFAFPAKTQLWIPLTVPFTWEGASREAIRSYLPSQMLIRLAPGVSAETADKRVAALFDQYFTKKQQLERGYDGFVMPLQQTLVKNTRTALLVLMGAAALVLLTACANVTNLLLSRAATRRREMGIRSALGASRRRIVQQLLTESLVLALAGGVLGAGVAYAGLGILTTLMPPQLANVVTPNLDARVLAFSLLLTTCTGVLFGMWPAFGVTKRGAAVSMSISGGYGATASDGARLRKLFVITEMAFALMLLIGAGLMLRSFRELMTTDTGVDVERIASVELTLPRNKYNNGTARSEFYRTVLDRLKQSPGVEAAAAINEIPLRGEYGIGISVEPEGKKLEETIYPQYLRVTNDYFRTMGIRLLSGRSLNAADDTLNPAVVINQSLANKLWPAGDALGKRFSLGTAPGEQPVYMTIVGIVADVRSQSIDQEPTPQMYLPFLEEAGNFAGIVVRGRGEPRAVLAALRDAVRTADPDQALYNLRMLEDAVATTVAPRRTNTLLIAAFGLLAVVLAAVGVYAVISYGVAQRTREIGIRLALGASVRDVLRMVVSEGLGLAVVGVAIGLAGAWALSRIMESLLYGVSARDPMTFVAAPLILLALALCATLLPARAAAKVDPMAAIRME